MKRVTAIKLTVLVLLALIVGLSSGFVGAAPLRTSPQSGAPLMFIENVGQYDAGARFKAQGSKGDAWLEDSAIWFTLQDKAASEDAEHQDLPSERHGVNLRVSFLNSNPSPKLEPFGRLPTKVSYFIGSDPASWHADVPVWGGVRYVNIYTGIDLEIDGLEGEWRWRLVVRDTDAADGLSSVRMRVDGAKSVAQEDGSWLRIGTNVGEHRLPLLGIVAPGVLDKHLSTSVAGSVVERPFCREETAMTSNGPLANPSDLVFSTFLGGSDGDEGMAIAQGNSGALFVAGATMSADFPSTTGAFVSDGSNKDVFVSKLNSAGSALIYSSYFGGSSWDHAQDIAVNGAGHAFIAGDTSSLDFPTTQGAFQQTHGTGGHQDAFVTRINGTGTNLIYSTFLGDSGYDLATGIDIDDQNHAYVVGVTESYAFPTTPGAFDDHKDQDEAFVTKFNAAGSALVYSTFVGGGLRDRGMDIVEDGAGSVYITGWTRSGSFPTTPGSFDPSWNAQQDGFVSKLDATGHVQYSTYLGANLGMDEPKAIALDIAGSVYVTGDTRSTNFPTTAGAYDTTFNGGTNDIDVFVSKLDASLSQLTYSTFIGTTSYDHVNGIAIDSAGRATVAGYTTGQGWPTTPDAYDIGGSLTRGATVTRLDPFGASLVYSTYIAGPGVESEAAWDVALDDSGAAIVVGNSSDSGFPTTAGAYQTAFGGTYDAIVFKLLLGAPPPEQPVFMPLVLKRS